MNAIIIGTGVGVAAWYLMRDRSPTVVTRDHRTVAPDPTEQRESGGAAPETATGKDPPDDGDQRHFAPNPGFDSNPGDTIDMSGESMIISRGNATIVSTPDPETATTRIGHLAGGVLNDRFMHAIDSGLAADIKY